MLKKKLVPFMLPTATSPKSQKSPQFRHHGSAQTSSRNLAAGVPSIPEKYPGAAIENEFINLVDNTKIVEKTFGSAAQRYRSKQIARENEKLQNKIKNMKKVVDNEQPISYK